MTGSPRRRLGELLLEEGGLSQDQLELALAEQRRTGELLGEILVRMGFVARARVAAALAQQAGIPFIRLREESCDASVRALLPEAAARRLGAVPLRQESGRLLVAMSDFLDVRAADELSRITGQPVDVLAASDDSITMTLDALYAREEGGSLQIEDTLQRLGEPSEEAESAVVGMVRGLLTRAVQRSATDVHIEPEEKLVRARFRVDGVLVPGPTIPKDLQAGLISRIKIMARLKISESRLPQDGRIEYRHGKRVIDIRVSTFPTLYGETVVLRLLDRERMILGLERLGLRRELLQIYRRLARRSNGIILVTGPTGSGKTTTLYSTLVEINSLDKKIITLEDPIEYQLPLIRQAQVSPQIGLDFAAGLRAIFRQDPDVILVGEIRDQETVEMAIRASLTGHLVFSTIHTNDAAGTLTRLLDMDVEPFLLASSLIGVMAQRLIRLLCPQCRRPVPVPEELHRPLEDLLGRIPENLYEAAGCERCHGTGYQGRTGLFELLEINPEIRELILKRASADVIRRRAQASGMQTMWQDGLRKVAVGQTSTSEILRTTSE